MLFRSLGVHHEVDDGIDGGVGHGQPEEGKEDVLTVVLRGDISVVIIYEVCVIGQPAHSKDNQDNDEHDTDLRRMKIINYFVTDFWIQV